MLSPVPLCGDTRAANQPAITDPVLSVEVGATPWGLAPEAGGRQRVPVGVVSYRGAILAEVREPYWALVVDACGQLSMQPQAELSLEAAQLAVGGFYPLVQDGQSVADRYPGSSLRAARVALAYRPNELFIIASDGSRPGFGKRARGLTTVELAQLAMEHRAEWALNLDGGRSAFVRVSQRGRRGTYPRVFLRRPGPVWIGF